MKALKKSVICVAAALVFVGCEKKVGNEEPEFTLSKGVLVLNQGNWGSRMPRFRITIRLPGR